MPKYEIETSKETITVDCDAIVTKDGDLAVLTDFDPQGMNLTPDLLLNSIVTGKH
jgi:5S rRNA maturation endonuclease (ribonuclease M5)